MHKRITLTLLLIVLVPAGLTWAAYGEGIRQSKHDFSAASWDEFNNSGEICIFCHAPHDQGRTTYENGLLWNRAVSQTPYTMYTNGYAGFTSLDGAVDSTPTGSSKLCLACHDGTLAMDSYGEHSGGIHTMWDENLSRVIPRAMDGGNLNLRGSHPISIVYSAAADGELHDPALATWANGSSVASTLESGKVQCASCHDVHNGAGTSAWILRTSNTTAGGAASGLCLTCHNK
ncbi:MAG: hypothetical protein K0A93_12820 [Desulfuromonadaceae bacterium]|nr:hypothetical protein [Desulfuromonadaceae bacterium]